MSTLVCRYCHQPIELVDDARGRRIALDVGTHPDGTIDIDPDGTAHTATAKALLDPEWPLRRLHRTSCAHEAHKRRRGRDAHPERAR